MSKHTSRQGSHSAHIQAEIKTTLAVQLKVHCLTSCALPVRSYLPAVTASKAEQCMVTGPFIRLLISLGTCSCACSLSPPAANAKNHTCLTHLQEGEHNIIINRLFFFWRIHFDITEVKTQLKTTTTIIILKIYNVLNCTWLLWFQGLGNVHAGSLSHFDGFLGHLNCKCY